jgi:hypothetical protein
MFETSKQLTKIMAPANKRKTEYFGGVKSERYQSERPGRREYGGGINFITGTTPPVKLVQPPTPQVQPPMDHHHP